MRYTMITFVFFSLLQLVGCSGSGNNHQATQDKPLPNIVVILADDLGYGDLSCYGNKAYSTPNIDQLAAEGARYTDFYAAPVCTPARAALLTGCYAPRVGLPKVVAPKGPKWTQGRHQLGLNPEEETLAELLKSHGYTTGCIGKWHLGHHPGHLPTKQGFDEYFGLPYSNDMWPKNNPAWPPLPLMEGDAVVDTITTHQNKLTTRYTERALRFIDQHQAKPFFLYMAHSMPHVPLYVSERGQGQSRAGLYGDVVREIDWSVGQVLAKLKALGIGENTLVVFTSDNGPWRLYGNHAGASGGLRDGKHTVFDGGVRVPFFSQMARKGTKWDCGQRDCWFNRPGAYFVRFDGCPIAQKSD